MSNAAVAYPLARLHQLLERGAAWLGNAGPGRRLAIALAAGLLSALAFAPFGVFALLLAALAVLVLLIDGAAAGRHRYRDAMLTGWAFGFGQFLAGLYWVGYAFTVDPAGHAWQIPFVAVLLPGGLAVFPAAACGVAALGWHTGSGRIFLFAACYALAEWLRGHVLTGFPWNLSAYGWSASTPMLQSTAVLGAYGLSLLTLLLGASLAECASTRPRAWRLPAALCALFACLWVGGALRLALVHPGDVPGVRLRLVQPNIPQAEKFGRAFRQRNWHRLVTLSRTPASPMPTHIIWPEAAPPFLLTAHSPALKQIAELSQANHVLMTGAVRAIIAPDDAIKFFNSFYVFADGGQLIGTYDKFHLVPFGEYLPLAPLLHRLGVTKLVNMPDGFGEGPGPQTLAIPGAPLAGPLICYEIIFPGEVIGTPRPEWLVNVTDDSWFGPSTGPYQHLLSARVRAIEEGLPIARAANSGVSAVIDPLGRVVTQLGLGQMGIVDADLPRAAPITLFARFGDIGFFLILAGCGLFAFGRRPRGRREA
ncbi:MAG TPA: apolipoprotein N-acyltransferase [Rhizomicrobium sp.]|jgi:apolipoprotein N-acyltransferase